jgi:SAM-dependent methyltransferase
VAIEEVYRHPEDYDLEVDDRNVHDLPFWLGITRGEQPKSVLEVGCGTGRLTIPLAREGVCSGFVVMGIDPERSMLEKAVKLRRREPPGVKAALALRVGDIRSSNLDRVFDLVIMPYGAAHHLLSLDDQLAAFRNARQHLRAGGLFCIDVDAPCLSVLHRLERGTPRRQDIDARRPDGRRLRRYVTSRFAPSQQRATHDYEYDATDANGTRRRYASTFEMHVYFRRELELLCVATGFQCERLIGDYDGSRFDDDARQMILAARAY